MNEKGTSNEIPYSTEMKFKMVIVVRKDIDMGKGKLAGQVAHAAVSAILKHTDSSNVNEWYEEGQKKVVLKVDNEEDLMKLVNKALNIGLDCHLIRDAGRTQLEPGTLTCFSCGPYLDVDFNGIFDDTKLF